MYYDLIVVGDGVAAYTAAIDASLHGMDVLFAKLPSDAGDFGALSRILRPAIACRIQAEDAQAGSQGAIDGRDFVRRVEQAVLTHAESLSRELARSGVERVSGATRFRSPREICVGAEAFSGGAIAIASVSKPRHPPFFPFDDASVCDQESIFQRGAIPKSLAVVGASEGGCELACEFAALGSSVVLIDRRRNLMRATDKDLLKILHAAMQRVGIDLVLGEEIQAIEVISHPTEPHVRLDLSSGRTEPFECVVVCAPRAPTLEPSGLREMGLARDSNGFIVTDDHGMTSQPGVYGIGEVSGIPRDVGTQNHYARVSVRHAMGSKPELEEQPPRFIYAVPEIASIGLSEEACVLLGLDHVVGVSDYPARAGAEHFSSTGLMKIVAESESGRVIGVHIIGPRASDTLLVAVEYVRQRVSVEYVARAILNSPGAGDAYRIAACDALTKIRTLELQPAKRISLALGSSAIDEMM